MSHRLLSALLCVTGILHFVAPSTFARIVPPALGDAHAWVYASGVAELIGSALVAHPKTRRHGALYCAALFVAVFPANVYMALRPDVANAPAWIAWARLPLQPLLIWWALSIGRRKPLPTR